MTAAGTSMRHAAVVLLALSSAILPTACTDLSFMATTTGVTRGTDLRAPDEEGDADTGYLRYGLHIGSEELTRWYGSEFQVCVNIEYAEYTDAEGRQSRYVRAGMPLVVMLAERGTGGGHYFEGSIGSSPIGLAITYVAKEDGDPVLAIGTTLRLGYMITSSSPCGFALGFGMDVDLALAVISPDDHLGWASGGLSVMLAFGSQGKVPFGW